MNESESCPKVAQADRVCLSAGEGERKWWREGEGASWPFHTSSSMSSKRLNSILEMVFQRAIGISGSRSRPSEGDPRPAAGFTSP